VVDLKPPDAILVKGVGKYVYYERTSPFWE